MMRVSAFLAALSFALAGAAAAAPIPPGSYQSTCKDIYADGTTLSATCRGSFGQWNYSTLRDYRDCEGDIANERGRLVCRDDPYDDGDDQWLPRGSYRETCRRARVVDRTLTAECVDRNGNWRYSELVDFSRCRGDIANANGRLVCRSDDDDDDWAPNGSYRDTCRRVNVQEGTLTAECRDRDGRWRYTELPNFRSCRGDIANVNGMLRCRFGDDDNGELPDGSWRSSCRNARVVGSILYAQCRNRYGEWRNTSLDLRNCERDVRNVDGRLVCGGAGGFGRITLYRHTNFGGKSRTFTSDVPDLNPYAFGNLASSVVVQGGVWQLCDRPNYRGYCIVIDRTNANLWTLGFNDRAESVRRVR